MLTEKQLKAREGGVTGSDVSKLVGVCPYGDDFDVFLKKTGQAPPNVMSDAMLWGHLKEPIIADHFGKRHTVDLEECDTLYHPDHNIWIGTPDRRVLKKKRTIRGLEIKTTNAFKGKEWGKEGTDEIPLQHLCQVTWYMPLLGVREMDIAVLIGSADYREYTVKRDDELLEMMWDKAEFFWRNHVLKNKAPQITGSDACKKFLEQKYANPTEEMIEVSPDDFFSDMAQKLHKARVGMKELDDVKKALENQMKERIGDRRGIESRAFRAVWSSGSGRSFTDWESVIGKLANIIISHQVETQGKSESAAMSSTAKIVEEAITAYTKKNKQRTFRFTWKKGDGDE